MKTIFADDFERPQLKLKQRLLAINWPFIGLITGRKIMRLKIAMHKAEQGFSHTATRDAIFKTSKP